MGLIISAPSSGVGKTTVTLALLSFLSQQGFSVQSFKVGPDYIDPMYHSLVTKRPCRNLDPVLTSCDYVKSCFATHCQGVDYALIEGVMGLFDGVKIEPYPSISDFASTAHISRLLKEPVLLVLDCTGLSGSVAAIAHGFRSFDPQVEIAGVVLNRVGSDRHLELLQDALEPLKLPILGVLRRFDSLALPDRHLGLVPPEELSHINSIFAQLAEVGKNCFDWEKLLPLLQVKTPTNSPSFKPQSSSPKIAIAWDNAFNFYYQDNLDILKSCGAELIFWSPMADSSIPEDVDGLYFGGGFPEVFAAELGENQAAQTAVKQLMTKGIPTMAECGGLMYLCEEIIDFNGYSYQMLGILPAKSVMTTKLTLGYRQATAQVNSLLLDKGEVVWGHEFHRSQLLSCPHQPLFKIKKDYEGWALPNLHASYIHLHFGGSPEMASRFVKHCHNYAAKKF